MSQLDDWVATAAAELGLESGDVQPDSVLDVARDVAHQVLRPAAPLTAYLMGVAVGRGADPADTAARISALARAWPSPDGETNPAQPGEGQPKRENPARKGAEPVADPPPR